PMPGRRSRPAPQRSLPARRCSAPRTMLPPSPRSAIRRRRKRREGAMSSGRDRLKSAAARHAVELVEDRMVIGLGPGSTAAFVIQHLAARVAQGLAVTAIPTSEHTAESARRLGIPLTTFAEHRRIDLAIDGADEVERGSLNLIKGHGGALLREKIVAAASN